MKRKSLYLVDVSSLFFRAFFAIRSLSSPSGMPVNAIYGFLTMIVKLIKDKNPDYLVFCYDTPQPSFRHDMYKEYKAHREEPPEDLIPQFPYLAKIAHAFGVVGIERPGFEADDIIGTLSHKMHQQGVDVYIVSGDKDFAQLVNDHVFMYDTMKDIIMGPAEVKEKWGVTPSQFIDYLALVGDSSDNIPGVKGIGPKGAEKLIHDFNSLQGIYDNLDKIESKSIKQKLIDSKDNAFLSQKLVTIAHCVPVSDQLEDYRQSGIRAGELKALLEELNFKSLIKTLPATDYFSALKQEPSNGIPVEQSAPMPETRHEHAITISHVDTAKLKDVIPLGAECWGISHARGLFLAHKSGSHWQLIALQGEPKEAGRQLADHQLRWLGYDLKSFWHEIGAINPQAHWDSELAAYVIKAGEPMGFDHVYTRFTGEITPELPSPEDILGMHLKLKPALEVRVQQIHAGEVLTTLDFPLVSILYKMETLGIRLDTELLRTQSQQLAQDIQRIEAQVYQLSGETFNIGSPKQLSQILFTKLALPVIKKTKTGLSTDNEVLEKLREAHPIIEHLLEYRELTKLKSTYVDALPNLVKEDGRIHSTFNQTLTSTGRLSSVDPNLQNIPIRTERGAKVRRAFVAEPGRALMSADYSQIELRVLAHYSGDKNMCQAFADDLDIHAMTAAEVFGVALAEVTSQQRRAAKAVNFGIAYGQGAFGLAENLGIPRGEAQEIIKKYFEKFPGVQSYMQETIEKATRDGYVETLSGRRRYVDELKSKNGAIRKFGERAAINAPIQGSASDIVKKAMIQIDREIPVPLILQVHDELIFEDTESALKLHTPRIVEIMERVWPLRVPLKANFAIGSSWDEAH